MNSDVFEISINLENKNSICSFNEVWYDDIRIQISTVDMLIRVFYHRWMKYTCIRRKPEKYKNELSFYDTRNICCCLTQYITLIMNN